MKGTFLNILLEESIYLNNKKALLSIINRLQGLREDYWIDQQEYSKELKAKWTIYRNGQPDDQARITRDIDYYKKIYDDYTLYFKTVSDLNVAESNRLIAVIAIIVAAIGVIVQMTSMFL